MSGDDYSLVDVDGLNPFFRIWDMDESLSFLNGSVDYGQLINALPTDDRHLGASGSGRCKSGGTTPLTPNSSASSSSTEDVKQVQEQAHAKEEAEVDVDHDKSKKMSKARKKGEKRKREARFAFMMKSEVDHLEDGYRWRKYGQKAVKNSPYPRSYYRCTTQKCGVKKRVERSFQDPTIVITTYEGQHMHQSPATVRGSSHFLAGRTPPATSFGSNMFPQILLNNIASGNMFLPSTTPLQQQLQFPDHGLLQDVVPSFHTNHP